MARNEDISGAPISYIDNITARYDSLGYKAYRWYHADTPPAFTPLEKPLSECRVGLISTSGAYVVGQVAYYYKDDTSIREIPKDTPTEQIHFSHITENYLVNPRKDPNCIFPIDTLREAERDGTIGELAPHLFSCMGGVYSQRRVREETIPDLRARFKTQAVDTVLLVPM
ncbi:MAG: glycine/sarcosine/betaine reductase selenoprotein B family protein [Gammaproteobacteria bacterium]